MGGSDGVPAVVKAEAASLLSSDGVPAVVTNY